MNDANTEEFTELGQAVAQAHQKLNTLSVPRTDETTGQVLTVQERLTWYREYLIARWTGETDTTWEAVALAEQRLLTAPVLPGEQITPATLLSGHQIQQTIEMLCANVAVVVDCMAEMKGEIEQLRRSEKPEAALAAQ